MIDTHCHLTYDGLHERVADVLAAARAVGVETFISVGTTPADTRKALALTRQHAGVYATVGVHPHYAHQVDDEPALREAMHQLAGDRRVVALGEMGLDWHYPDPPRADQRRVFAAQLAVARELPDLPIVIHNREATDDVLAMIREADLPGERFVFHCFTGTPEEVRRILDLGARVGFTGIVTFNSAQEVAQASDDVPLDRLLIETDSPYLTPAPYRKVRPNEPKYVVEVARFLAHRRGLSLETFNAAVEGNARSLFTALPQA
jgi:TatD DNase family protein